MKEAQSPAEWRDSLLRRLNEQVPNRPLSGSLRIRWLADHLEEYVEHWIAFTEHPAMRSRPPSELFESGLFQIIGVAFDIIDGEVRNCTLTAATRQGWVELQRVYSELLQTRAPHLFELLRLRTRAFRECLPIE